MPSQTQPFFVSPRSPSQLDGQMVDAPTSKLPVAEKEQVDDAAAQKFLEDELPDLQKVRMGDN